MILNTRAYTIYYTIVHYLLISNILCIYNIKNIRIIILILRLAFLLSLIITLFVLLSIIALKTFTVLTIGLRNSLCRIDENDKTLIL